MKPDSPEYEFPVVGTFWAKSVELGAGVFFLDDRTYVAGHGSPAERQLLERGALRIATLCFDPDPREASHPGRPLILLGMREAARRFGGACNLQPRFRPDPPSHRASPSS